MRIRYRRAMVVAPLICAMVFFAFPLKDRLAFSIFMLNGVPLLVIAFALRFRSLGELTDRELILRALYGGKEARFPRGNLSVVDDKIYAGTSGSRSRNGTSTRRTGRRSCGVCGRPRRPRRDEAAVTKPP